MGLEIIILASLGFFIVIIRYCYIKTNKIIINLLLLFVSPGCF